MRGRAPPSKPKLSRPPMSSTTRRVFLFGEFELNLGSRTLTRQGRPIPLGSKAFDLLACLVAHAGQPVSKADLLKTVWPDAFVEEGNLPQHIFSLRKALGDCADYILTLPGRGYQFTAPVTEPATDLTASNPTSLHAQSDSEIIVTQMRERTHVVIEESYATPYPDRRAGDRRAATPQLPGQPSRRTFLRSLTFAAGTLALALLAIEASTGWHWLHRTPRRDFQRIVLADFTNATGDAAFDSTLKRALAIDLEQSPYIDVLSEREAVSLLGMMGRAPDTPITAAIARELCERSNRQVLLTGALTHIGQRLLLTLEATDCATGKDLTGAKAQAASKDDILTALDTVAGRVRAGLGESPYSLESHEVPILQATTPSLEALKNYSIGVDLAAQGKPETETLPFFQHAVQLDPNFATAYGAIATTYYNLNEYALASQFYRKAFDLSSRVGLREQLSIRAHFYSEGQGDLEEGIKAYQQWANTYPHDWIPWVDLANVYTQLGRYPAAIDAGRQALVLGPDRAINFSVLARALMHANRFAEAKQIGDQAIAIHKDSGGLHATLYEIAFAEQDQPTLARELAWNQSHNGDWYLLYTEGKAAAFDGRLHEMERLLHQAEQTALRDDLPESAEDIAIDRALFESEFGLPTQAHATLTRVNELAAQLGASATNSSDLALLRAQLGDTAATRAFLERNKSGARVETARPDTALAPNRSSPSAPFLDTSSAPLTGSPSTPASSIVSSSPSALAGSPVPPALTDGPADPAHAIPALSSEKPAVDTLLTFVTLPRIRALLLAQMGGFTDAVAALEPAIPYELVDFTVPFQRAADLLAAHDPNQAAREYRKILANRGIDTLSPLYPLAELGLARCYAQAGDRPDAATHYQAFLTTWKSADPDLPILKTARQELAQLH
jgi:DNA-binding winged helix-turn-helix (wHTH) protein/tetratricopeptide (TPR) repeat protein